MLNQSSIVCYTYTIIINLHDTQDVIISTKNYCITYYCDIVMMTWFWLRDDVFITRITCQQNIKCKENQQPIPDMIKSEMEIWNGRHEQST